MLFALFEITNNQLTQLMPWILQNELYFVFSIGPVFALLMLLFLMGRSSVLRDLQELTLYELLLHSVSFIMYLKIFSFLPYPRFELFAIGNAITILKITRLLWNGKSTDGSSYVGWPMFGIIGYLHARSHPEAISKRLEVTSKWHDPAAYACIGIAILLGYLRASLPISPVFALIWVSVPLIYLLVFMKRNGGALENLENYTLGVVEALAKERTKSADQAHQLDQALERAAMATALQTRNAELAEANERMDKMLAEREAMRADLDRRNLVLLSASHDLRNPLFVLRNFLDSTMRAKDDESRDANLQQLSEALDQFGDVIECTILNAKITTKLATPALSPVPVDAFTDALCDRYIDMAEQKGIYANIRGADYMLRTSRVVVLRILNNLLHNAIGNTERGGVLLLFRRRKEMCSVEVWDTGCGIPHAEGPDGAANFQRAAEALMRRLRESGKEDGHGIGLNNVGLLCESIGTTMTLRSRVGVGTVFRFELPIADESECLRHDEEQNLDHSFG